MTLRFAVVTDIHYGFDRANKKGSRAPKLIDRFIKAANGNGVDFAVDMGDRVIVTDPETDRRYLRKLKDHFNALAVPGYSIHGNHDLRHMSREDNAAILDRPAGSHTADFGDYTAIFWSPNVNGRDGDGFLTARREHIEWLRDTLARATKPCVLFSHVPLDNSDEDDAQSLLASGGRFPSFYGEGREIRQIMEDSGKVMLCMAGHRHRNRHREINGIHYVTQQSLVQKHERLGRAIGAFSIVTINDREIHIKGYGIRQPVYTLPRASNGNTGGQTPPAPEPI